MARPLGKIQEEVLRCLRRHGGYPMGWVWDTPSGTVAVLESLVRRGLVAKTRGAHSGRLGRYFYEAVGNRAYDGTMCACGRGPVVWDYDPFVAEIHETDDASALLCDECFQERKDDI